MNLLVLNSGSGSHKCSLFCVENDLPVKPPEPVWKAVIMATSPGNTAQELSLTVECEGRKKESKTLPSDLSSKKQVEYLLKRLQEDKSVVLKGTSEIDVVGHRVVHGGTEFDKAVVVDANVESIIQRLAAFAPLQFIGVEVDSEKNASSLMDSDISLPDTPVRVLIVKSREDWQIALECREYFENCRVK
jgi:acetate kinase